MRGTAQAEQCWVPLNAVDALLTLGVVADICQQQSDLGVVVNQGGQVVDLLLVGNGEHCLDRSLRHVLLSQGVKQYGHLRVALAGGRGGDCV